MIYILAVLLLSIFIFLFCLWQKSHDPKASLGWLLIAGFLLLGLIYPNAGRGWF